MKVFLLRHGTRNFTLGDVPLNDEGIRQAEELTQDQQLCSTSTILCSPKKRAQMTVSPLASKLNLPIETLEELDQMNHLESEASFINRVKNFVNNIEQQSWQSPVLICSHSDWLSIAAGLIPSNSISLKHHIFHCAEYLSFDLEDDIWSLNE